MTLLVGNITQEEYVLVKNIPRKIVEQYGYEVELPISDNNGFY
jgi:hypothetical protein